jgi:protein-S-isoprenylcysteine O-methyltransferase Ste14
MTIIKEAWRVHGISSDGISFTGKELMSSQISTLGLIVQSIVWAGILFALPFAGAGTFAWPEGWAYIVMQFSSWTVMTLWLKKNNPELLRVRAELWKRTVKPWDKVILTLIFAGFLTLFFLPGLDAVRYQWSHVPLPPKIIGFVGTVISNGLMFWVLKTNPYSSAAVEVQKERGHRVITTGPYQYVRHPMYVGGILMAVSTPLALGSLVTFIPSIILTVVVVVRTYLEDKTLDQELEGYLAYSETVKYRLIPGVW